MSTFHPQIPEIDSLSDKALLVRFVTKQDQSAFRLLVTRHSSLVWSVCRRLLPCPRDREDVFQATFLKLVVHADRNGWQDVIGPWLYKVAYRLSLNTRAARRRRRETEFIEEPSGDEDVLETLQRHDAELALHEAILQLPALDREALLLCYFQNKPQAEVALEIGCSINSLRVRLHRSRRRLFVLLGCRGLSLAIAVAALEQTLHAAPRMLPPQLIEETVEIGLGYLNGTPTPPVSVESTHFSRREIVSMLPAGITSQLWAVVGFTLLSFCGSELVQGTHGGSLAHAALRWRKPKSENARVIGSLPLTTDTHFHELDTRQPQKVAGDISPELTVPRPEEQEGEKTGDAEIENLVNQLGSDGPQLREAAFKRLTQIGSPAKAPLKMAMRSSNERIRSRAKQVFKSIAQRELWRLKAFENGTSDVAPAGWERYCQIVGDSPDTRRFFVEMQQAEQDLLEAYANNPNEVTKRFVERCAVHQMAIADRRSKYISEDKHNGSPHIFLAPLAALLLVAGDEKVAIPEKQMLPLCYLARHTPQIRGLDPQSFRENTANRTQRPDNEKIDDFYRVKLGLVRQLLIQWMQLPIEGRQRIAYRKVGLLDHFGFNDNLALMVELATNRNLSPEYRVEALIKIGLSRTRDARDYELLEPLLEDTTLYAIHPTKNVRIEIRDVALVTLLNWSQKLYLQNEENNYYLSLSGDVEISINPQYISFTSSQGRDQAFAKWRARSQQGKELKDRVRAFADSAGKVEGDSLPGWNHYRRIVGNDPSARALFVEILSACPELFTNYENNFSDTYQRFTDLISLSSGRREILAKQPFIGFSPGTGYYSAFGSVENIAGFLLIASDERLSEPAAKFLEPSACLVGLLHSNAGNNFRSAIKSPESKYGPLLEKLLRKSLQKQEKDSLNAVYQKLCTSLHYDFKRESLELALELLKRYEANPTEEEEEVSYRDCSYADILDAIGKSGDVRHIEAIEGLLANENHCMGLRGVVGRRNGPRRHMQVREGALAVAISLSNQPWTDYGLRYTPAVGRSNHWHDEAILEFDKNYNYERAVANWHAWSKANLKKD